MTIKNTGSAYNLDLRSSEKGNKNRIYFLASLLRVLALASNVPRTGDVAAKAETIIFG
jgi:hypothetical protein